ncbi:MAG: hypothetical protein ACRC1K_09995, partial [Planctomycetia bacterium]
MKLFAPMFAAMLAALPVHAAEWQSDYGMALDSAKKQDKPVLVLFSADATLRSELAKMSYLVDHFVVVAAEPGSKNGASLRRKFEMPKDEGCVVVDR